MLNNIIIRLFQEKYLYVLNLNDIKLTMSLLLRVNQIPRCPPTFQLEVLFKCLFSEVKCLVRGRIFLFQAFGYKLIASFKLD